MKIQRKIFFVLIFQLLFLARSYSQNPVVEKGLMDLRGWNWEKSPEVNLKGEWNFHWNKLVDPGSNEEPTHTIKVPSAWNKLRINETRIGAIGFGTYSITILTDKGANLAIRTTTISTAFDLYVNGVLISSTGVPGKLKDTTIPKYKPTINSIENSDTIKLVLHVSNFHHRVGGIRDKITIGTENYLLKKFHFALMIDLFLAGCFIMIGLYHLVLYIIKEDKSPLYFSIFCLLLTLRLFVTDNIPLTYFVDIDWSLLIRLEYLSFYLGGLSFLAFFYTLFGDYIREIQVKSVYGYMFIMSLLVLLTPTNFFTNILFASQFIVMVVSFYMLYILWKAYKDRNKDALVFLGGYVIMVIFFINDLLHTDEIIETTHLFSVGLFIFLISQAILLSKRYAQSFKNNEYLLQELNSSNKILESKVRERTDILENQKTALEQNNLHIKEQNNELVKLNKEMDNFVYSVSHDLKAPLASMLGLIDLSRDESDLKTLKHYHEMMERSLSRQKEFISEILDYSRNARLELHLEELDFKKILTDTFEQFQFINQWEQIEKIVDIDQKGDFRSDKQRVNIILNNLISNALKYSTVANESPKVHVTIRANSERADITIMDNGCGIPEDKVDKIFDMFYRADDRKSGSGLGLYIVMETLTRLRGTIDVQSKYGEGTTIQVTIPSGESTDG